MISEQSRTKQAFSVPMDAPFFKCPICGSALEHTLDIISNGDHSKDCPNPNCAYLIVEEVRDVVCSLLESGYTGDAISDILAAMEADDGSTSFTIDSRDKVEWYLKKLATWDNYIAGVAASENREIDAIRARSVAIIGPVAAKRRAFEEFFGPQVIAFAKADMAVLKKKTANYFYGAVKVTATPEKLKITDPDLLLNILLESKRDDLIRTTHELKLKEVKAAVDSLPIPARVLFETEPAGENIKVTPALPVTEVK